MNLPPTASPWVAWGRSALILANHQGAEALLTPAWRERHGRFRRHQDADDFLAARMLVFELLHEVGVGGVRVEQRCDGCGKAGHGRPVAVDGGGKPAGLAISWAHSRGVVVAALARGVAGVGVDIEHASPEAAVAPEVPVSGRHFVRMEALVKTGILDLDAGLEADLSWPWGRERSCLGAMVRDLNFDDGVVGAVAWRPK